MLLSFICFGSCSLYDVYAGMWHPKINTKTHEVVCVVYLIRNLSLAEDMLRFSGKNNLHRVIETKTYDVRSLFLFRLRCQLLLRSRDCRCALVRQTLWFENKQFQEYFLKFALFFLFTGCIRKKISK